MLALTSIQYDTFSLYKNSRQTQPKQSPLATTKFLDKDSNKGATQTSIWGVLEIAFAEFPKYRSCPMIDTKAWHQLMIIRGLHTPHIE